MGELPASDFAVAAYVPEDIDEITQGWLGFFEEFYGVDATATDVVVEAPLTDAEYTEYMELDEQYWAGTLAPEDEDRYFELDGRYWAAGTEDEPWAEESYAITLQQEVQYCLIEDSPAGKLCAPDAGERDLGPAYQAEFEDDVELRLKQAGVRLAALLRAALAP